MAAVPRPDAPPPSAQAADAPPAPSPAPRALTPSAPPTHPLGARAFLWRVTARPVRALLSLLPQLAARLGRRGDRPTARPTAPRDPVRIRGDGGAPAAAAFGRRASHAALVRQALLATRASQWVPGAPPPRAGATGSTELPEPGRWVVCLAGARVAASAYLWTPTATTALVVAYLETADAAPAALADAAPATERPAGRPRRLVWHDVVAGRAAAPIGDPVLLALLEDRMADARAGAPDEPLGTSRGGRSAAHAR